MRAYRLEPTSDAKAAPKRLAVLRPETAARVLVDRDETLMTAPHLILREVILVQVCVIAMALLSLFFDAPLEGIADPTNTPNPAKAPWYFLGLQELVSYSAFMGGIGIPTVVLVGLALIPYLDREAGGEGEWFGGAGGLPLVLRSAVVGLCAVVAVETLAIRFGWIREWWPAAPQLLITFVNPGTVLTVLYGVYSVWCVRRYDSTRAGALALYTCFLCGFVVLTVVGVHFRGPNWGFYWSPADWPRH
jgi:cytochrome b-561